MGDVAAALCVYARACVLALICLISSQKQLLTDG